MARRHPNIEPDVAVVLALLALPGVAAAEGPEAVAVGLTGGVAALGTRALDDELEAYGFAPVGSPALPHWGVRGRITFPGGIDVGVAMVSSFASRSADDNPVPTTTGWTRTGSLLGLRVHRVLRVGTQLGFASLTHSVGSTVQGGALVYLGPYVEPELKLVVLEAPQWVQLTVGLPIQLAPGRPHQQALWEEDFVRRWVVAPMVSLTTGPGWTR